MNGYIGRILLNPLLEESNELIAKNVMMGSNKNDSLNIFFGDWRKEAKANTNSINVGTGVFTKNATK